MYPEEEQDFDIRQWNLSGWFMGVAETVCPSNYQDKVDWATAAYKLWQRTGIKPEEVRAARCPNWKSSYEEYKKRERRNKTKVSKLVKEFNIKYIEPDRYDVLINCSSLGMIVPFV